MIVFTLYYLIIVLLIDYVYVMIYFLVWGINMILVFLYGYGKIFSDVISK